mgnify:CR=1 FL=1
MNYYDRLKADNKMILTDRIITDATITNPSGQSQAVKLFYIDAPLDIDPQSGLPIRARRIAGHIHRADLTIGYPDKVAGDWRITFVNNSGDTINGVIQQPDPDHTLGMLSFVVKIVEVVT